MANSAFVTKILTGQMLTRNACFLMTPVDSAYQEVQDSVPGRWFFIIRNAVREYEKAHK
jgi:hypothetical protein